MRRAVVAGNWKMNFTRQTSVSTAFDFASNHETSLLDVILCVPYVFLQPVMDALSNSKIKVAAQNMHYEEKGAFTGEVSCEMLKEMGLKYVLVGHSERRQFFGETDETVNLKVLKALEQNITPILCVGESLEQRKKDVTNDVLRQQVNHALQKVYAKDVKRIIIAYEPVWAIGTGAVATPKEAEDACKYIRDVIKNKYGAGIANDVTILYGGSVDDKNSKDLFGKPNIDGGLVGGASMNASFLHIVKAMQGVVADDISKGDNVYG